MDEATRQHLARLEREIISLRRELRSRGRGRWLRTLLPGVALIALLAAAPLVAFGANFQDLHPGSGHNPNINVIADAGITRGCFDTAHYCPDDLVTREQMASFLARTAGLGNNPPVTNALTAVNAQTASRLATEPASGTTYTANSLVRVAHASRESGQAAGPTPQTLVTVTIEAPTAGFVLVTGTTTFNYNSAQPGEASARVRDTTTGAVSLRTRTEIIPSSGGAVLDSPATPSWVFPVTAGERSFVLEIFTTGATTIATAGNSSLTALFVPFDGAGNAAP